jgi:hypothetical protein
VHTNETGLVRYWQPQFIELKSSGKSGGSEHCTQKSNLQRRTSRIKPLSIKNMTSLAECTRQIGYPEGTHTQSLVAGAAPAPPCAIRCSALRVFRTSSMTTQQRLPNHQRCCTSQQILGSGHRYAHHSQHQQYARASLCVLARPTGSSKRVRSTRA